MLRLLFLFLAVAAAVVFVHWLMREDPKKVAQVLKRTGVWIIVGALVLLAVTGRLHWLYAAVAALLPMLGRALSLLRYVPLFSQLYTQVQNARAARAASSPGAGGTGRSSHVQSRFLRMVLNHDSGEMDGEVLAGRYQGRRLSSLSLPQLIELLRDYRDQDEESVALLQAFLDRVHGEDWHQGTGEHRDDATAVSGGTMSRQEACEVLGVDSEAGREEIIAAHRRLMQKLHPDRGGSTYLAAKINQAKDMLLNDR